ncbi:hypothetical protein H2201_003964 [Coniosporium apollinis]|uniref:RRM domain-containing protein n=2 Tax=Coniosporium TaxID=2810619 RepID=A0ABQ9NTX8_9PEZI|nr:hypothetical protein H2199_005537 [Cladosporium sp. JES 115]KAJ9665840.1 hypothetical protein H2201_003964 [Coniosporium apollinis]
MSHSTEFEAQGVLREKKEKKSKGKENREERRKRKEEKEAKRQRKAEKEAKKSKKRKHDEVDEDAAEENGQPSEQLLKASDTAAPIVDTATEERKKSKRRKKSKATTGDADAKSEETKATDASSGDAQPGAGAEESAADATASTKSQRFICFIGNLPYTATADSVTAHFSKVSPTSVRLMTDKATGKPKGFAFIEFDAYDRMKTCLKLYHHSSFDDGVAPARKINVELTAGGGGKGEARKEKLQVKNERLSEQRKRRMLEEEKQKARRDKKGRSKGQAADGEGAAGKGKGAAQMDGTDEEPRSEHDSHGIHPSRLARMR